MSKLITNPFDVLLDFDRRGRERAQQADDTQAIGILGRLAVRLSSHYLMLAMEDIAEIIPLPAVTHVPNVKPWLMGIANLRGTVISVVNLGDFLLDQPTTANSNCRVVVVKAGEWSYGLLIDEIIGMRHFQIDSTLTPNDVEATLQPYTQAIHRGEDKVWLAFDIDALISNATFLDASL